MQKLIFNTLLLIGFLYCTDHVFAETIDARLRINQRKNEEQTITRDNLIKIQQFILIQGKHETYCNRYSNSPAYHTENYRFYLNPNNSLTIRKTVDGKWQYQTVQFLEKHSVYITVGHPADDLTVKNIRQFVEDAIKELLDEIKKKEPNKTLQQTAVNEKFGPLLS